tara:strand:+ start:1084 stop:1806 length:723 start_codon:yes stop_codon:yes gene_type:complete
MIKLVSTRDKNYQDVLETRYATYSLILRHKSQQSALKKVSEFCHYDKHSVVLVKYVSDFPVGTIRATFRNPQRGEYLELEKNGIMPIATLLRHNPNIVELSRFGVIKDYRRSKKIMFELLTACLPYLKQKKVKYLTYKCSSLHIDLHQSLGFIISKNEIIKDPVFGNFRIGYIKAYGPRWFFVSNYWRLCSYCPCFYRHREEITKTAKKSPYVITFTIFLKILFIGGVVHILSLYLNGLH